MAYSLLLPHATMSETAHPEKHIAPVSESTLMSHLGRLQGDVVATHSKVPSIDKTGILGHQNARVMIMPQGY